MILRRRLDFPTRLPLPFSLSTGITGNAAACWVHSTCRRARPLLVFAAFLLTSPNPVLAQGVCGGYLRDNEGWQRCIEKAMQDQLSEIRNQQAWADYYEAKRVQKEWEKQYKQQIKQQFVQSMVMTAAEPLMGAFVDWLFGVNKRAKEKADAEAMAAAEAERQRRLAEAKRAFEASRDATYSEMKGPKPAPPVMKGETSDLQLKGPNVVDLRPRFGDEQLSSGQFLAYREHLEQQLARKRQLCEEYQAQKAVWQVRLDKLGGDKTARLIMSGTDEVREVLAELQKEWTKALKSMDSMMNLHYKLALARREALGRVPQMVQDIKNLNTSLRNTSNVLSLVKEESTQKQMLGSLQFLASNSKDLLTYGAEFLGKTPPAGAVAATGAIAGTAGAVGAFTTGWNIGRSLEWALAYQSVVKDWESMAEVRRKEGLYRYLSSNIFAYEVKASGCALDVAAIQGQLDSLSRQLAARPRIP